MDILKVPGKVRMKRIFFARQFLYGNIESVWDSADATNTFFQALFMERLVCALYAYLQSLSLLVKLSDLLLLANLAKMSLFTHFVAFWRNVVIYARCGDLRIFPGKKLGSQAPKTIMHA